MSASSDDDGATSCPESPGSQDNVPLAADEMDNLSMAGLYAQYFAVGIVASALPATLYGFFLGYLGVDSYVYSTAAQVIGLPWSFKILFGMANDCFPLRGYHRKPYMVAGWTICAGALIGLANTPMPDQGDHTVAGKFSTLMALAAVGYIMADVAADGLTVEFAKLEDEQVRGTLQSNVYLVRALGSIVAALVIGVGMNGKQYNGEFEWTLDFTDICGILAVISAGMVPVSAVLVHETPKKHTMAMRTYLQECYKLLSRKAMFYVALYCLAHGVVGDISTTASGNVARHWAGVRNMQAALFGIVGALIFAAGLQLVKRHLLHVNWRHIIIGTTILLTAVDALFSFCTIFDVVRNQYFYLGETVIVEVPAAARFLMTTFVVVEMAEDGQEGMVYGLLTMLHNLGGPVAQAISNSVFGTIRPSLSNADNYILDTNQVRKAVAISYGISYAMGLLALLMLPLFPSQKAEARQRMIEWPHDTKYAKVTIAMTCIAWVYSVTMNMLAMFPATQCLQFVGGEGCS